MRASSNVYESMARIELSACRPASTPTPNNPCAIASARVANPQRTQGARKVGEHLNRLTEPSEPISQAAKWKARKGWIQRKTRETGLEFTLVLNFWFLRWSSVYYDWIWGNWRRRWTEGEEEEGVTRNKIFEWVCKKARETRYAWQSSGLSFLFRWEFTRANCWKEAGSKITFASARNRFQLNCFPPSVSPTPSSVRTQLLWGGWRGMRLARLAILKVVPTLYV